jgi:hypothetical protein
VEEVPHQFWRWGQAMCFEYLSVYFDGYSAVCFLSFAPCGDFESSEVVPVRGGVREAPFSSYRYAQYPVAVAAGFFDAQVTFSARFSLQFAAWAGVAEAG